MEQKDAILRALVGQNPGTIPGANNDTLEVPGMTPERELFTVISSGGSFIATVLQAYSTFNGNFVNALATAAITSGVIDGAGSEMHPNQSQLVGTSLVPAANRYANAALAIEYGLNVAGTSADPVRQLGTNSDAVAVLTVGALANAAFNMIWNGTTWDRLRSITYSADNSSLTTLGTVGAIARLSALNGSTIDRLRTQSSINAALATQIGVLMVAPPANWAINHTPAAAAQATISRAAVASVRHICTSISAVMSAAIAVASGVVQLSLRDGATGAGTILWSQTVQIGGAASVTAAIVQINITGLQIFGSVNTAMTLEFSAAGGAGVSQSVSMTGYDVA